MKHKIPESRIVAIPHAMTPMLPVKSEFRRFTTPLPVTEWNMPTLRAVALRSFCAEARKEAESEIEARK